MSEKRDWLVWLLDHLATVRMFMYVLITSAGISAVGLVAALLTGQSEWVLFHGVVTAFMAASAGVCWLVAKRSEWPGRP